MFGRRQPVDQIRTPPFDDAPQPSRNGPVPEPISCEAVTAKIDLMRHHTAGSEPLEQCIVRRIDVLHMLEHRLRKNEIYTATLHHRSLVPRSEVAHFDVVADA